MEEKFTFFWKSKLSQWHMVNFTVDDVTYNCAEQYMMAEKARLFNDKDALSEIMNATHPGDMQKIGRKIKNFDQQVWDENAKLIVYRGNLARFMQNDYQWQLLKATAGTTLVEASPYDAIWGIRLGADDHRVQSRLTWRGKNWLGEILTKVREDIIEIKGERKGPKNDRDDCK